MSKLCFSVDSTGCDDETWGSDWVEWVVSTWVSLCVDGNALVVVWVSGAGWVMSHWKTVWSGSSVCVGDGFRSSDEIAGFVNWLGVNRFEGVFCCSTVGDLDARGWDRLIDTDPREEETLND